MLRAPPHLHVNFPQVPPRVHPSQDFYLHVPQAKPIPNQHDGFRGNMEAEILREPWEDLEVHGGWGSVGVRSALPPTPTPSLRTPLTCREPASHSTRWFYRLIRCPASLMVSTIRRRRQRPRFANQLPGTCRQPVMMVPLVAQVPTLVRNSRH